MRRMLLLVLPALVFAALPARSHSAADWYTKAVKSVTASFEPAEAKPGQTVTFKLSVDLNEGYYTYPLMQKEKGAANYVNRILFPPAGTVIFVGDAADPAKLPTKVDPSDNITMMSYCPGAVTYSRKAVVSPRALSGVLKVATEFKLSVCDEGNCYPVKSLPVEAELKVLEGPALPVEKDFVAEVEKALTGK